MSKIVAFFAALLLLVSASCGNSPGATRSLGSQSEGKDKGANSAQEGDASGKSGTNQSGGVNSEGSSGSPAPNQSLPTEIPGIKPAPLEIQMKFDCVRLGAVQSMTVKTNPGFKLAYGTQWPDRSGHPEWAGAYGNIDSFPQTGTLVLSWNVPSDAPMGDARTDVSVVGKVDGEDAARFDRAGWKIAKDCS